MDTLTSQIYDNLRLLEVEIEKSFPIVPNYLIVVNVSKFNSILNNIYNSLPQEVKDARDFLNRDKDNIYNYLKTFEIILSNAFSIIPNVLVIVKIKELENTIDKIYASLPYEIKSAREYLGIQ